MSHAGCRSSGVLSTTAVVSVDRAKIISVHLTATIGHSDNVLMCSIYDSATATTSGKTELVRFALANGARTALETVMFEADMHGVIALEGIYCVITALSPGGNTLPSPGISIEFA